MGSSPNGTAAQVERALTIARPERTLAREELRLARREEENVGARTPAHAGGGRQPRGGLDRFRYAVDAKRSIERAHLRQQIAREVIDWCRRIQALRFKNASDQERTAAALQLHDLHARHARERGDEATAAKAEERYDRELARRFGNPPNQ